MMFFHLRELVALAALLVPVILAASVLFYARHRKQWIRFVAFLSASWQV